MSGAYYNDNDPFVCAWVRELMKRDLIAPGEVDERSIEDVHPEDVRPFTQAHFFCGIAVWSYALRAAGWPDDLAVWTGSCPCQGFSASGQRGGFSDKRHLWPAWFRLISECRPVTVFGEQVASKDGLAWLDVVSADMENAGYAIGAADTCAAGFGAPHIRQRLYFAAGRRRFGAEAPCGCWDRDAWHRKYGMWPWERCDNAGFRSDAKDTNRGRQANKGNSRGWTPKAGRSGLSGNSADSDGGNTSTEGLQRSGQHGLCTEDSRTGDDSNASNARSPRARSESQSEGSQFKLSDDSREESQAGDRLDSNSTGSFAGQQTSEGVGYGRTVEPTSGAGDGREWRGPGWLDPITARSVAEAGATRGFWSDCDWWYGRDGKYRPIGTGLFPLVAGATGRMGKLCGYGNALCAPQAQAFIEAYMSL